MDRNRLRELAVKFNDSERRNRPRLEDKTTRCQNVGFFIKYWEVIALDQALNEQNIDAAIQSFFTCARLQEYRLLHCSGPSLGSAVSVITHALLSDNSRIINRFGEYPTGWYQGLSCVPFIQMLIRDEFDRIRSELQRIEATVDKWFSPDFQVLTGLVNRDAGQIVRGVQKLLEPEMHNYRNGNSIRHKFMMPLPATTYLKLASIMGTKVEMQSNLVPTALMPRRPAIQYHDQYDFLKEL